MQTKQWLDYPVAILAAIGIHLVLLAVMAFGLQYRPDHVNAKSPVVNARLVDMTAIYDKKAAQKAKRKRQEALRKAKQLQLQKQRKAAQEKRLKEAREKIAKKKEADAKALIQQQIKQRDEQKRLKAYKQKQQQIKKKKAEEKLKKQQQEKRRQEQLKQLERLKKERIQAGKKRRLEEERLAQLEAQRKENEQKELAGMEEQRRKQLLEYENRKINDAKLGDLQTDYVAAIQAQVTQNWLRPPTAKKGLSCKLRIHQIPGGEVINVSIISPCNADETTQRSLVAAVKRARSLPYKGFEKVFERQLTFNFIY